MANSSPSGETSGQVGEDFFSALLNLSPSYEQDPALNIVPPPPEAVPENQENPPAEAPEPAVRRGRVRNRSLASREPLTMEYLSSLYHLTEREAAKEAGWGLGNFRKQRKELGIEHWPYRKLKSVTFVVNKLQELRETSKRIDQRMLDNGIPLMENTRQQILNDPNFQLEPEAIRLRKVANRSIYKRKRRNKEKGEASSSAPGN